MGFNFPTSPSVGTLYPNPPVTGWPVYRWDGEKWKMQNSVTSINIQVCPTRTALAAIDTTSINIVYLTENGREGVFVWKTGNYSSQISTDTNQGVFVKATAIAVTAGSWVRVCVGFLVPEWFGALKDGVSDDSIAINAAMSIASLISLPEVIMSGTYTIANPIVPVTGVMLRGSGAWARVNSNTNIAVQLSVSNAPLIHGGLKDIKFVNANPANTNAVGMKLDACQRCTFSGLEFYNYDAGTFAIIQPTVVYNGTNAGIYGPDYHNFVWNKFENIMVAKCAQGMVFRGGPGPGTAPVTNVVTLNDYYNVCIRQATLEGLRSDWYHDNDHFYNFFVTLVANAAVGVHLSASDPTNYVGVSAHHFHTLTIVRDASLPTALYGIAMNNAPGCLFVGLGSDNQWDGTYFYNPLSVETYVLASWMHFPASDASAGTLTNRLANVTQGTMTRQSASVTCPNGTTSVAVTFPYPMLVAPVAGKGEIRLTATSNSGVVSWVDTTTITKTGFTIRYSGTTGGHTLLWTAEVFVAS